MLGVFVGSHRHLLGLRAATVSNTAAVQENRTCRSDSRSKKAQHSTRQLNYHSHGEFVQKHGLVRYVAVARRRRLALHPRGLLTGRLAERTRGRGWRRWRLAGRDGNIAGAIDITGAGGGRTFPTQACLDQASALLATMTAEEKISQLQQIERVDVTANDITTYGIGSVYSQGGSAPTLNTPAAGPTWQTGSDERRTSAV